MTEATWIRKKQICQEILETLKVLEPGLTVRKARLMYELHLPLIMLAQVNLNKKGDKVTKYMSSYILMFFDYPGGSKERVSKGFGHTEGGAEGWASLAILPFLPTYL